MNPHPAQQMTNVPVLDGEELKGVQHKYRDIILFFPSQGKLAMLIVPFAFGGRSLLKSLI